MSWRRALLGTPDVRRRRWGLVSLLLGVAGVLHVLEEEWARAAILLALSAAAVPLAAWGTR